MNKQELDDAIRPVALALQAIKDEIRVYAVADIALRIAHVPKPDTGPRLTAAIEKISELYPEFLDFIDEEKES